MIKTEFPNTVAAATALTDDEIACAPGPALVAIYNLLTEGEEVKRFATRADGVKRVTKLVAAARNQMKVVSSAPPKATTPPKGKLVAVNGTAHAPAVKSVGPAERTVAKSDVKPVRVGARTEQLILSGFGVADVVAALRKEFPDKANSEANVRWYRGKLKREGRLA